MNVRGVCATAPLNGVTTYAVMADPPSVVGAVQCTVADALPGVAAAAVGTPGAVGNVTEFVSAEAGPEPTALRAVTAHVYALPFVKLETVIGLDVLVAEPAAPPLLDVHVAV